MGVMGLLRGAFRVLPLAPHIDEDWSRRFEREYPVSLPGRLEFLEQRLGLSRERILRLAGAPPAFAADAVVSRQPWDVIVAQQSDAHRDQLAAAEKCLADYLALFGYDWAAAADHIQSRRAEKEVVAFASSASSIDHDDALRRLLADCHSGEVFDLMTEFLSRELV